MTQALEQSVAGEVALRKLKEIFLHPIFFPSLSLFQDYGLKDLLNSKQYNSARSGAYDQLSTGYSFSFSTDVL